MFSVYDKQRPICKSYRNIRDMFSHYFIDSTGLCMLQSLLNETLYAFHILLNLTGTVSVFCLKAKMDAHKVFPQKLTKVNSSSLIR